MPQHVPANLSPRTRILLYSHDSFGLGHLRRSMTLAGALAGRLPSASVLIASGSPCATHFPPPPGVDVVKLPSITKDEQGRYVPRTLGGALKPVLAVRSVLLAELVKAFRPHLLVVDHQVTGLDDELLPALDRARDAGARTILGLRDVIDEPAAVARAWDRPQVERALDEAYDAICVYGWPTVFDPRHEYPALARVAERLEFTGYVVRPAPARSTRALPSDRPQVLVTIGGGEDGGARIETYLAAIQLGPVDWDSTIVLGPLLESSHGRRLKRQARLLSGVTVHSFHADLPRLLAESDAVVSMAGYNTTAEILQSGTSAVLLPRLAPRREQQIRAERLAALGLAESLEEPEPVSLRAAIGRALTRPRRRGCVLPLDGDARLCALAADLLGLATPVAGTAVAS
jgi:predicted glycosyltransferase